MEQDSKRQRVTPIAMDVAIERLPHQTITREEYQRLGGVPIKAIEDAEVDSHSVMGAGIQDKKRTVPIK